MSEFSGLNIGLTSLQTQRRGLELAAQNVANANTDGYSRQRLDLESIGAPSTPAFWSKFDGDGSGVQVADVARFRDQFMEIQAALEHGSMANLDVGSTKMQAIQQLFNEPSDTGLAKQMSDFWAGWDDVANNPGDTAARTQLLNRASTLASSINTINAQLAQLKANTTSELGATAQQINTTADQIAQLNQSIKTDSIAGLAVNDLLDKRDLLANKLAEMTGGSIRSTQFGQVNVVVGGTSIVQEGTAQHIQLDTSGSPTVLRWVNDNSIVNVTSGKIGGELNTINTTIPSYVNQLNTVATTMRDEVNNLHGTITGSIGTSAQDQSGSGNLMFDVSLDGGAFASVTVAGADWSGAGGAAALQTALQNALNATLGAGNATATVNGGNGSPLSVAIAPTGSHTLNVRATSGNNGFATLLNTTAIGTDGVGGRNFFTGTDAATFAVASAVANNPAAVAAGLAANGPLDGSNALNLADLSTATTGADATYRQMIVQLGVDTQTAMSRADIQDKSTQSLDNSRNSYSGVNTDEEMTNMVEFQHAYEAASRFITTIDSILDTLINHTGMTT